MADDEKGTDGISVNDLWATEAKEFFEAHPPDQMSESELAALDIRDRDSFPLTMTGYQAWKAAASRHAQENPAAEGEGGPGPTRAGEVPSAHTGAVPPAVKAAAKKLKASGKTPAARAAFIKTMRENTSSGILD